MGVLADAGCGTDTTTRPPARTTRASSRRPPPGRRRGPGPARDRPGHAGRRQRQGAQVADHKAARWNPGLGDGQHLGGDVDPHDLAALAGQVSGGRSRPWGPAPPPLGERQPVQLPQERLQLLKERAGQAGRSPVVSPSAALRRSRATPISPTRNSSARRQRCRSVVPATAVDSNGVRSTWADGPASRCSQSRQASRPLGAR
jgi:hypothetical protein